ncbi:MAG: KEOPS complex subunit Cgi121 [Thermoplasmata archaeon]
MVHLAGLRGDVTDAEGLLKSARESCGPNGSVQLLRASMVFGRVHLESAAEHAARSFEQGRNSSNSLATEALLYASGSTQISKAIEKMGIGEGDSEMALIAFGEFDLKRFVGLAKLTRDDDVLEGDLGMLPLFGITEKEMASVSESKVFDLVLEKVAMVDILK